MKLLEYLQGKWLGDPLHSAMVHIPVGAWTAACGLDVAVAFGWSNPAAPRLALYCVAVGLLGGLAAIPAGFADWLPIKPDKPAKKLGWYHMLLNVAAMLVWVVNLVARIRSDDLLTRTVLITSVLGTLIVFVSGYLGSLMVFDRGTAVARESKKEWKEIARRAGSRVSDEK